MRGVWGRWMDYYWNISGRGVGGGGRAIFLLHDR